MRGGVEGHEGMYGGEGAEGVSLGRIFKIFD